MNEVLDGSIVLPPASVVVPVRNAPMQIARCIEALLTQTYPQDRTQLVVVDNGSDDDTLRIIESYPVTLLVETSVRSPYAARNAGIRGAVGEVVAFTDADCVPAPDWLERGVCALLKSEADLVGGKVEFVLSTPPLIAETVDALLNLDVKTSIEQHRACMTGNLFVRSGVFTKIGLFDQFVRSGGDMRWTRRATDAGFRLEFESRATVGKRGRRMGPLLRKQYRVGCGVPGVWTTFSMSTGRMATAALRGLLPMPPHRLPAKLRQRGLTEFRPPLVRLWLTIWLCKIIRSAGLLAGSVT